MPLTDAELEETEPLVQKIQALETTEGKELSGLQLMNFFSFGSASSPSKLGMHKCGITWFRKTRLEFPKMTFLMRS
jgi:hypothetical protein